MFRFHINLNFEPSSVGIDHVLKVISLFEHEFQARKFANFEF